MEIISTIKFVSGMAVQNISESLYVGMCKKIGIQQQVAFRRDIMDIEEKFKYYVRQKTNEFQMMDSAGEREGFRFSTSDIDIMCWSNDYRVIWDVSQSKLYSKEKQKLVRCDSSESRPGFTLLWLSQEVFGCDVLWQTLSISRYIFSALVRINERLYISSFMYRQNMLGLSLPNSSIHGPCSNGRKGFLEYDIAHCFVSDFWPPSASSWIDRCHSWPPSDVVNDIVRNGCHLVAIGHKLGNHADNEWRISFSDAEYKLVQSMNHTQFLTYGLLKFFLKEVINNELIDEDKVLCSYFMKTIVLWAIQQDMIPCWSPKNLLGGLWTCIKLLLKWVYEGVCPNFFISHYNMFLGLVYGQAQENLFLRLNKLYEMGPACLLHSPTIRSAIIDFLCNPKLAICIDELSLISETAFDKELFHEMYLNDALLKPCLKTYMLALHIVEQFISLPMTQYRLLMLQKLTVTILQKTAYLVHRECTKTCVNKVIYTADKLSCRLLQLAARFGCVSDMLYIAMYYYKTSRYRKALSITEMTEKMLKKPYLMYNKNVCEDRYLEAVGGKSLSIKMKLALAQDIILDNRICYINELSLEQKTSLEHKCSVLYIPPMILLLLLEFLSSRHVAKKGAQLALSELEIHLDKKATLIPSDVRDISWEILGICQQMAGNLQAAMHSYQQSLSQEPFHIIQIATIQRIHDLLLNEPPYQDLDLNEPPYRTATNNFYSQHGKQTVRNSSYSNVY